MVCPIIAFFLIASEESLGSDQEFLLPCLVVAYVRGLHTVPGLIQEMPVRRAPITKEDCTHCLDTAILFRLSSQGVEKKESVRDNAPLQCLI